ncbi:uncharacterized protein LOC130367872 isoform X1 [Hyla sarda]|uniref:uncharacterized protein LOC130367872 isoform X1 n=1 Tax=Hyla sarda TaxID=327740 RepID=UPI0024C31298|nr:uncharacterized protein LOC130367872 isoform X1 [Hyla sarda]
MYGNVDYVPSPPEEASLKRSPSEHSSIYLQEESIYEPVRSSEKPDSENLWRLSSLGSSAEDTTLRWNQGPPLRNNAWIPSYQRHCWQKHRLMIIIFSFGLLFFLTICILGFYMSQYYAMETELKTVKEQHRYITMGSFLLYNEDHKKCAEVRSSSSSRSVFELTASVCSSVSYSQRFQWLPGGRLMSSGEGLCVGVEGRPQSLQPLKLYPCDTDKTLSWQCSNETLLGVKGEKVFFNYGNNSKYLVILYWGTGVWSRWRARTLDGKILDGGACA